MSSVLGERTPSTRPCKFFRKGACRRGASCKYLHIDGFDEDERVQGRHLDGQTSSGMNAGTASFVPKLVPCESSTSGRGRAISQSAGPTKRPSDAGRSRKQKKKDAMTYSGNYLLNFSYRPVLHDDSYASSLYVEGGARKRTSYHRSKYKKHRYLQANYRFALRDDVECIANLDLTSPDKPVDWKGVEYIEHTTDEKVTCPICLEYPVAPLTTKCGHFFCTPCFLRHMSLADRCRCPICFADVFEPDLKPVSMRSVLPVSPGHTLEFVLMRREPGNIVPLPRTRWRSVVDLLPVSDPDSRFSRYCVATEIENVLREEERALEKAAALARSCGEESTLPFIVMAQERCANKRAVFYSTRAEAHAPSLAQPSDAILAEKRREDTFGPVDSSLVVTEASTHAGARIALEGAGEFSGDTGERPSEGVESTKTPKENDGCFYYYQERNGLNLFVSPFDMKVLRCEFGEYDRFPDELKVEVLALCPASVDEAFRKRYHKMIGHLALATPLFFCEVEVLPLLSGKTRKRVGRLFADEFAKRRAVKRSLAEAKEKLRVGEEAEMGGDTVSWDGEAAAQVGSAALADSTIDGAGAGESADAGRDGEEGLRAVKGRRRRRGRKGKAEQRVSAAPPPSFANVAKKASSPSPLALGRGKGKKVVLFASSGYRL